MKRLQPLIAACALACSGPSDLDAGDQDASTDAATECASAAECDDGSFCNGEESCDAGAADADVRGCAPGTAPCEAAQCDEVGDACDTPCTDPDADGDGRDALGCGGDDCDDTRSAVYAGQIETCDTLDNDCDGLADEGVLGTFYRDADGDGYGDAAAGSYMGCTPTPGYSTLDTDCDDDNRLRNPATTELCSDSIDNNCDGRIDESGPRLFYRDADGDGFGTASDSAMFTDCTPPTGYAASSNDCDDANDAVHPGAPQLCNRVDDDCSAAGAVRLAEDADLDEHASPAAACTGGFPKDDCNDGNGTVHPGVMELCNRLDDDCSSGGGGDAGEDADGDMHTSTSAVCMGGLYPRDDCDDTDPNVRPGAVEPCDRLDENCSSGGGADVSEDRDSDMYAPIGAACAGGFPSTDCNDMSASVHPTAAELCNASDDDCSSGGGADTSEDRDADMHSPIAAACTGGFARDDCNDMLASVHPGVSESCDRNDTNCSTGGGVDTAEDFDDDGHAPIGAACTGGRPADDCDDRNAAVYPGSTVSAPEPSGPPNNWRTGSYRGAARGTLRPTFRWRAAPGCGVTYDLQVDDTCSRSAIQSCSFTSPEINATGLTATSHRPAIDLPVSTTAPAGRTYYWRVRACVGAVCSSFGRVRFLEVGVAPGDFDGDGYSDLIVGAYGLTAGGMPGAGSVFVYRGSSSGVPAAPSTTLIDPVVQMGAGFGSGVAVCDINGDRFADAIIGAWAQSFPEVQEGSAFVFLGGPTGLTTSSAQIDNPDDDPDALFGHEPSCAGDTNADGYDDFIIGAPGSNTIFLNSGAAFLYLGSAFGTPAVPLRSYKSTAPQTNGFFGYANASAGDLNGDGYGDIVIGASGQSGVASAEGAAFVYYGGLGGPPAAPTLTLRGDVVSARFGFSVASGDVNGDGYSDLLVGARARSDGAMVDGTAYVFHGGTTGIGAAPTSTIHHPSPQDYAFFGQSISSAGDVNGDGFDDTIVSAHSQDGVAVNEGAAYLFLGRALGIATTATVLADPGGSANAYFGTRVASIGDVNGDGLTDVAVGAPEQMAGFVFVYHGGAAFPTAPTRMLASPGTGVGTGFGYTLARPF